MNLLVLGGSAEQRRDVALAFHLRSPLRLGPFVALDCEREEAPLIASLNAWLSSAGDDPRANPLRAAQRGMLFLDSVGSLSSRTQSLLLVFTRRFLDGTHSPDCESWAGRLAAGNPDDLARLVASGDFSPALYDCLDKIRVECETFPLHGAA